MKSSLGICLAAAAWCSVAGAQVGAVRSHHKISNLEGDFPAPLLHDDYFGIAVAPLGDLNADKVPDVAVAAYGDDTAGRDSGAVWLLLLRPDGRVLGHGKITGTGDQYSHGLANLGDLDGDGLDELAVGIPFPTRGPPSVDIAFLLPDATVRRTQRILATDPVFFLRVDTTVDLFGYSACALGDVDGDGIGDVALGVPGDNDGGGRGSGALWIVYLQSDGRPKSAHKISQRFGGGEGLLRARLFGFSIACLGDLDRDGGVDLLSNDSTAGRSSFLVLYLDRSERLRDIRRISQEDFGLDPSGSDPVSTFDFGFGQSFAVLGDLDRNGTLEFAVGAPGWTPDRSSRPELTPRFGAILVGSLRRDGVLARSVLISAQRGGFHGDLELSTDFGYTLATLGDLDGDGGADLVAGVNLDEDGAHEAGAAWILELDTSAVRNGSGVNPLTLRQAGEPNVAHYWKLTLDCRAHAPGLAQVAGFDAPLSGFPTPAGELLVDVFTSPPLFHSIAPHSGGLVSFLLAVPRDVGLIGRGLSVQGLSTGAPGPRLSNALDVVIGR